MRLSFEEEGALIDHHQGKVLSSLLSACCRRKGVAAAAMKAGAISCAEFFARRKLLVVVSVILAAVNFDLLRRQQQTEQHPSPSRSSRRVDVFITDDTVETATAINTSISSEVVEPEYMNTRTRWPEEPATRPKSSRLVTPENHTSETKQQHNYEALLKERDFPPGPVPPFERRYNGKYRLPYWAKKASAFEGVDVPKNKSVCFVHVGKAAGSTIGCSLGAYIETASNSSKIALIDWLPELPMSI